MWRPEHWPWLRPKPAAIVRLARGEVSLLRRDDGGWRVQARAECAAATPRHTQPLRHAIQAIAQEVPPASRLMVVCDSCWLPVFLVRTGAKPLSRQKVLALARHRLGDIHGAESAGWVLEIDHVPGDPFALAFALPTWVEEAIAPLNDADGATGRKAAIQASLAWAWNEVWRKAALPADAWLLLAEQDRTIALARQRKRIAALQPCGPRLTSPALMKPFAQTEANRFGMAGAGMPIHAFAFEPAGDVLAPVAQADFHITLLTHERATA